MGANVSNAQVGLFKQHFSKMIKQIHIFFDGDDSGRTNSVKLEEKLLDTFVVHNIETPDCKQPENFSKKELTKLINTHGLRIAKKHS